MKYSLLGFIDLVASEEFDDRNPSHVEYARLAMTDKNGLPGAFAEAQNMISQGNSIRRDLTHLARIAADAIALAEVKFEPNANFEMAKKAWSETCTGTAYNKFLERLIK